MPKLAGKTFLLLVICTTAVLGACSKNPQAEVLSTQAVPAPTESVPTVVNQAVTVPTASVSADAVRKQTDPSPTAVP
jgi:hypothetical protein